MTQEKATAELTLDEAIKAAKDWQENAELAIPAEIVTGLVDGADALLSEVAELKSLLKPIIDCYGLGLTFEKFGNQVGPFILEARAALLGKER